MAAVAGVLAGAGGAGAPSAGGASTEGLLARALQVIEQQSAQIEQQSGEIRELREQNAQLVRVSEELRELVGLQAEQLAEANATIAVLQRIVFGRSSEKSGPAPDGGSDDDNDDAGASDGGKPDGGQKKKQVKRGPGARSGRRDYSGLPRFEVFWDFPGGGYCCPGCGEPFSLLGDHWSGEQLDWQVIIRLVANCQRRYKRECRCEGPATVMAPGPPKAIGKGLFTNGFIAMLLVERFEAGRSANSLATGLARQGAEISPATLAGTVAQAGRLLAPVEEAIAARNRDSWHLHADETSWRVFCPDGGDGPARFWLWVFIGADTVCFVMDPARSGEVLARHAGLDKDTGQLIPHEDGGPRRWSCPLISTRCTNPQGTRPEAWSISTVLRMSGGTSSGRATRTRRSCGTGRRSGWTGSGPCTAPTTNWPPPGRTARHPPAGRKQQPRNGWRRHMRHGTPRSA